MKELELGVGDTIEVYKANMIIPQISDNLTRSGSIHIPAECPVCGGKTSLKQENDVESLYCSNEKCLAKQIKAFTHFVGRDAMNIEGLSEATIEKLIAKGLIKELADLFHVEKYEEEIITMEGFGQKSYANLVRSIDKARNTTPARLLYSLGIPNIGVTNAKLICRTYKNDWDKIRALTAEALLEISGIGEVMAESYVRFFNDSERQIILEDILKEIKMAAPDTTEEDIKVLENLTFVITGSLNHFENRNALKDLIEEKGGKATGSVSEKTNYLINNDHMSSSAKNQTAKKFGIPIITEDAFLEMLRGDLNAENR